MMGREIFSESSLVYLFILDWMCGKTFDRFAQCTASREQYMEHANQLNVRRMLCGATKFPKYPGIQYRPLCKLYGLQDMGKSFIVIEPNFSVQKFTLPVSKRFVCHQGNGSCFLLLLLGFLRRDKFWRTDLNTSLLTLY